MSEVSFSNLCYVVCPSKAVRQWCTRLALNTYEKKTCDKENCSHCSLKIVCRALVAGNIYYHAFRTITAPFEKDISVSGLI